MKNLFGRPLVNSNIAPPTPSGSIISYLGTPPNWPSGFYDTFSGGSIGTSTVTTNTSPGQSASNVWSIQVYSGKVNSGFAFVPGGPLGTCLSLKLYQTGASSSQWFGSEIISGDQNTSNLLGYGAYEFYCRMGSSATTPTGLGSPVSGGVSSPFTINQYTSGGVPAAGYTELDAPEVEGYAARSTWAQYRSYKDASTTGTPAGGNFVTTGTGENYIVPASYGGVAPAAGFNYYGFIWAAGSWKIYLNGVLQGSTTTNVPVNPAWIDLNHYGTNSTTWGGTWSAGNRYFYVQSVAFWPGVTAL